MDCIVQWATILSPIIAILIAVWAIKSSAKATAKQIDALKDSTTQQVESVKELAKIQIRVAKIQLCKELFDLRTQFEQRKERLSDEEKSEPTTLHMSSEKYTRREEKRQDLMWNEKNIEKQVQVINKYMSQLDKLVESLGGEQHG